MFAIANLQALKNAGCNEVVLAINYQPKVGSFPIFKRGPRIKESSTACNATAELLSGIGFQVMMDFLKEWEEKLAIKITCSQVRQRLWSCCFLSIGACREMEYTLPS